jgi:hypothetical protein
MYTMEYPGLAQNRLLGVYSDNNLYSHVDYTMTLLKVIGLFLPLLRFKIQSFSDRHDSRLSLGRGKRRNTKACILPRCRRTSGDRSWGL